MIHVQTLDRKIWDKDSISAYLQRCAHADVDAVIDFSPEGSSAEALGMYRLLDRFCDLTGYKKSRITIRTGNVVEQHPEYNIERNPEYWYEIAQIQLWLDGKTIQTGTTPSKHFANFISRSNWFRLWTATILSSKFGDKTLQTYHYDPLRENYNFNGHIGIDDLFRRGCDVISEAVEFVQSCPRTIDLDYLADLTNSSSSVFQHTDSYYPIQHPSNLNLLQYYNDIFVDVVVEPNISGSCFLVTEKLWRPIVARRPFIVVSNAEYLMNLRKLGFKTFDAWWNEDYDWAHNGNRIKKIDELLTELAQWSTEELEAKLIDMSETLEHNYETFVNLKYDKIRNAFGI
jgi:hypothetical protein